MKKLLKIAIIGKFQLHLRNNDRNIGNGILTWFLSNYCILSLELNVKIQAENTVVCMASLLSLNGHISSHFDTIHLKLSTHGYFALLFHSISSEYENSKNKFL